MPHRENYYSGFSGPIPRTSHHRPYRDCLHASAHSGVTSFPQNLRTVLSLMERRPPSGRCKVPCVLRECLSTLVRAFKPSLRARGLIATIKHVLNLTPRHVGHLYGNPRVSVLSVSGDHACCSDVHLWAVSQLMRILAQPALTLSNAVHPSHYWLAYRRRRQKHGFHNQIFSTGKFVLLSIAVSNTIRELTSRLVHAQCNINDPYCTSTGIA